VPSGWMCRLFAGAHLSHTYHCDKHFFGTAEFYSVLIEEQRARYSVQVWETAWLISFKGVNEDEERGEGSCQAGVYRVVALHPILLGKRVSILLLYQMAQFFPLKGVRLFRPDDSD